jgi:tRNA 2-selenouridine synthase
MHQLEVEEFLSKRAEYPVLDIRSPSEYLQGHIPSAVSFPLFSDQERAQVGKTYKRMGKREALKD